MNLNSLTSPTLATYTALQQAFDHFNAELFGGELPACLITLRSSNCYLGYHQLNRFLSIEGE